MSKQQFKKISKASLLTLFAVAIIASAYSLLQFASPADAQTTASAPTVYIQYGDDADTSPDLPQDCYQHTGSFSTSTYDGNDPDCLRAQIVDSADTVYSQDFKVCLIYQYSVSACTGWASEIGLYQSISPMTPSSSGGTLAGTMQVQVQTRAIPTSNFPAGTTFGQVRVGVALAYREDYNPCRATGGIRWVSQGQAPSVGSGNPFDWAFSPRDNDPGCFQVGLSVGQVNAPPDAEFVSSTLPSPVNAGQAYNNNYSITMRNTGMPWPVYGDNNNIVRNVDGHCDRNNFPYDPEGQLTCTDYMVYTSQRFRLVRTDSSNIEVRSKALGAGSNEVTYSNGSYSYSGSDTIITSNPGTVTNQNTIPFFVRQDITYHRSVGEVEICVPGGPGSGYPPEGGGGGFILTHNKILNKLASLIIPKSALAYPDPNTGEECSIVPYDYIIEDRNPWDVEVSGGDTANFAPINITPSAQASGVNELRFKMVDMNNLNTTNQFYTNGKFGDEALINIQVNGSSFTFTCGANQSVQQGSTANYLLNAYPDPGMTSPVNVTLSSNPTGPSLTTSPVVLNTGNNYQGTAQINTTSLSPNTYHLTFSATNGGTPQSCYADLTVEPLSIVSHIQFDDSAAPVNFSDGPVSMGNTQTSGTLRWETENATSCTASMVTPPSPSYSAWSGSKSTANSGWVTEAVSGLSLNSTYQFKLTCQNQFGTTAEDIVEVTIGPPNEPTVDLECEGTGNTTPNDGPCNVTYGSVGLLFWTSSYANSCSLNPTIPGVTPGTSETGGISTGNLYTDRTYTITCTGASGTTPATDTVSFNVGPAPQTTADLKCIGSGGGAQSDGPCIVTYGQAGTIYWTATNAGECFLNPGYGEIDYPNMPGNTTTGPLYAQQVYTLSCDGAGGPASDTITFNVQPTADIDCKPGSFPLDGPCAINYGSSIRLVWTSSNTVSCSIDNGIGSVPVVSQVHGTMVSPTTTTTYTITCNGEAGTTPAVDSVTITINDPTISLSCTSPISLVRGGSPGVVSITSSVSSWPGGQLSIGHSFNPNGGTLPTISYSNNPQTPPATTLATISTTPATTLGTYTITFTAGIQPPVDGFPTGSCTVTLIVSDSPTPAVDLRCAGEGDSGPRTDDLCSVFYGDSATLYINSVNVESCEISPAIAGYDPRPNAEDETPTDPLTSNTTYIFTCEGTNGTGSFSDDVTINIIQPTISLSCAPSPINLTRNQAPGVASITSSVTGWQGSQISINHSFGQAGEGQNLPSVSYSNNPQSPPATTLATISTDANTDLGSYTLTFTGSSPGAVSDSCDVTVNVSASPLPTVDMFCNLAGSENTPGNGPCNVNSGEDIALTWTYSNATSCSIDQGIGPVAPSNGTTQVIRTMTASTTFRITCSGPGSPPNAIDDVTVNVIVPTFGMACTSPVSITTGGAPGTVAITTSVTNWVGGQVTLSHSFNPSSGILPSVSYTENPHTPPGSLFAIISAASNATAQTYVLTFTATQGATTWGSCNVTLVVSSNPTQPPTNVQASAGGTCGTINVTWQRPSFGPVPTQYQVYRTTTVDGGGNPINFVAIGTPVNDLGLPGNPTFSYLDGSPVLSVQNFYGVSAISGGTPSTIAPSNGVVPTSCSASLDQSDKDLSGAGTYTADPQECNNTSDPFNPGNDSLFKVGDTVYFEINVCNSGNQQLTGLRVVESSTHNLTNVQLVNGGGCVSSGTGSGPYNLNNLAGKSLCKLTISARITQPVGEEGVLFRFWNIATIESNELPDKVVATPPYLFSLGGEPSRGETPR